MIWQWLPLILLGVILNSGAQIALKYGAVPIVRATGGLADTVFDIELSKRPEKERNGFTFEAPSSKELCRALDRAFDLYKNQGKWELLVLQGMAQDHSWTKSAEEYQQIYKKFNGAVSKASRLSA